MERGPVLWFQINNGDPVGFAGTEAIERPGSCCPIRLIASGAGGPTIRGGSPIGDILRIGLGFIVLGGIDRADSALRVEHAGHVRSKMNRAILDIDETGWQTKFDDLIQIDQVIGL